MGGRITGRSTDRRHGPRMVAGGRASLARPGDGDDRHDGGGLSNPGLSKLATLAPELRHLAKFLPPLWEDGFSIIRSKSAVFGFPGLWAAHTVTRRPARPVALLEPCPSAGCPCRYPFAVCIEPTVSGRQPRRSIRVAYYPPGPRAPAGSCRCSFVFSHAALR